MSEIHVCKKCDHAFWPLFMADIAKCRLTRVARMDGGEYIHGKSRPDDSHEYCLQKRKCWAWQIEKYGAPSPTCPDYTSRKRRRRWWLLGFKW